MDVRIIATINENSYKLTDKGRLRKDFYYRLSVIRINILLIRERRDDIKPLCEYFIEHYNKILFKNVKYIIDEVLEGFLDYNCPGNIRELKNYIEGSMNMIDNGDILTKEFFEHRIN